MAQRHWVALSMTEGLGPVLTRRLIELAGGVQEVCSAPVSLFRQTEGIGQKSAEKIHASLAQAQSEVDCVLEKAAKTGIGIVTLEDGDYSPMLKLIPDPPVVLYFRGDFQPRDLQAIGIVGSRRCSFYGREQAERFGALLAGAGMTVVSGGARGVDSAAHRGAISHPQGRTFAVLGSGVDVAYPPENEDLFKQIAARGAVISEYPIGTPPVAENFPRRNRIISGLSRGVLVVEADIKSGALITARSACDDQNRTVFAIPGKIDNPMSAGTHKLIRDGAVLTTCLDDILEGLAPFPVDVTETSLFDPLPETAPEQPTAKAQAISTAALVSQDQQTLLGVMDHEPSSVDAICERSGLAVNVVLRELTVLSLRGLVRRVDGQSYVKRQS